MFTPGERARIRSTLLERAARDQRISGAAITGSGAADREDRWSDIDLAFALVNATDLSTALSDWTAYMYEAHSALHHLDVPSGAWIYRVFLLPGALQVDMAFVPANEFRPLAPTFRLVFGSVNEPRQIQAPSPAGLIGLGWLYALHARSSIARGHLWQAEYMISGLRDHALALACLRTGLPAAHGRGLDRLPPELAIQFEGSLVRQITRIELTRAFQVALKGFLSEIFSVDKGLWERLREPVGSLHSV